jgi:hypothetical protein
MRCGVVQPPARSSPAVATAMPALIRADRSSASTSSWNNGVGSSVSRMPAAAA